MYEQKVSSQWSLDQHRLYWRQFAAHLTDADLMFYLQVMRNAVKEIEAQLTLRTKGTS
jgi:hypothetical protein